MIVEPVADATPADLRLFLLGSTVGALLYQRGLLPLHGATIEAGGKAVIFVGASGAGKSTVAGGLAQRG